MFNKFMSQNEYVKECTPVTYTNILVYKTSSRYEFSYLLLDLIIEFSTFKLYNVIR